MVFIIEIMCGNSAENTAMLLTILVNFLCCRGTDFRPDFVKAVELRTVFSKAPWLGLSATVNKQVLKDIRTSMQRLHSRQSLHKSKLVWIGCIQGNSAHKANSRNYVWPEM